MIMRRQCVMSSTLRRASYIDSRSFLANGMNLKHALTLECAKSNGQSDSIWVVNTDLEVIYVTVNLCLPK